MAIDWGQIGTNVVGTLAAGLTTVGLTALQQRVGEKIQQVKPAVEAAQKAAAQPAAQPIAVQQAAQSNVAKYAPWAVAALGALGMVWYASK